MEDEKKLQQAKKVFDSLCAQLDSMNWHYEKHEEDLVIISGVKGDDLPMKFMMAVRPQQQVVQLRSSMPFNVGEDKRAEMALAICAANYGLINGSFDLDLSDGEILFRMTSSYLESIIGGEMFSYMIGASAGTIDEYNDKFLMVSTGAWNIEQFMEWEKNHRG